MTVITDMRAKPELELTPTEHLLVNNQLTHISTWLTALTPTAPFLPYR